MKKQFIFSIFLTLILTSLNAQVKFSLHLLSDQETYLVSMIPDQSMPAPYNRASNIQVVLKVPLGIPFSAGELQSQIPGIDWADNAIQDQHLQGEHFALCAFVMTQSSTKALVFEAGVEQPLFTFKNGEGGCVGAISLPKNQDEIITKAVAQGLNFTQSMTLLATRGNAYSGVLNKIADCNALTTSIKEVPIVQDLKAYPVPTSKQMTIEWANPKSYNSLQLDLINTAGQLLQTKRLDPSQGAKKTQLNLENHAAGLYNFRLKNDQGGSQYFKFIMVNQN